MNLNIISVTIIKEKYKNSIKFNAELQVISKMSSSNFMK
jgi:hypothetical protein